MARHIDNGIGGEGVLLTDEGLDLIEHQADKMKNVSLMMQVQILREIRGLKRSLEIHKDPSNSSDHGSCSADDGKNEHS